MNNSEKEWYFFNVISIPPSIILYALQNYVVIHPDDYQRIFKYFHSPYFAKIRKGNLILPSVFTIIFDSGVKKGSIAINAIQRNTLSLYLREPISLQPVDFHSFEIAKRIRIKLSFLNVNHRGYIEDKDVNNFREEIFQMLSLSVMTKCEMLFFDFRGQRFQLEVLELKNEEDKYIQSGSIIKATEMILHDYEHKIFYPNQ